MRGSIAVLAYVIGLGGCAIVEEALASKDEPPAAVAPEASASEPEDPRRLQAEQNRRDNEDAIRRAEDEKRARELAYRQSPEGRRTAYREDIAAKEDCIKKAQGAIDKQSEIAKVSGFVDKQVMYFAGKFLVECRASLAELRKACKADKLC